MMIQNQYRCDTLTKTQKKHDQRKTSKVLLSAIYDLYGSGTVGVPLVFQSHCRQSLYCVFKVVLFTCMFSCCFVSSFQFPRLPFSPLFYFLHLFLLAILLIFCVIFVFGRCSTAVYTVQTTPNPPSMPLFNNYNNLLSNIINFTMYNQALN